MGYQASDIHQARTDEIDGRAEIGIVTLSDLTATW